MSSHRRFLSPVPTYTLLWKATTPSFLHTVKQPLEKPIHTSGHSAGEEPGIIPRAMKDIFLLFASQKKENIFYDVPIFENL
jgi:hypothetical protein